MYGDRYIRFLSMPHLQEEEDGGVHVVLAVRIPPLVRRHHLNGETRQSRKLQRTALGTQKTTTLYVDRRRYQAHQTDCLSYRQYNATASQHRGSNLAEDPAEK